MGIDARAKLSGERIVQHFISDIVSACLCNVVSNSSSYQGSLLERLVIWRAASYADRITADSSHVASIVFIS